LPFLPCDRLRATCAAPPEGPPEKPYAFVAKQGNALRLTAVDRQALALGLAPGLTLADARARVPELATEPHDAQADRHFLERVADACGRYSPAVALDPPDGVTIDITGCDHLWGGEDALVADMRRRFAALTHAGFATADTPEAAQALARHGGGDVMDLPVAALRLDAAATTALIRAGLKRVGDLATRPSAMLAARFGPAAADRLDRILGRTDSRLVPRRAVPQLVAEQRFAEPIVLHDQVLDVVTDLAVQLSGDLTERGDGARALTLTLCRSDGDVRQVSVESGRPVRDRQAIRRLFAERIATLADPLDPGFGYDLVRLSADRTETLSAAQLALEGGTLADEALSALVDRLSTRLGRGRVRRMVPADTHIPEQRVLALPALDCPTPQRWPPREPGEPPLRPLHLFDPPQPVDVIAEVPDGPPHRFRWRRNLHDVARYEGPERIAAEWWRRRDGAGLTRDYYRVEDVRGRRFWLFRHGLYGAEATNPRWYLHGLFA
jgi:protein ImuB